MISWSAGAWSAGVLEYGQLEFCDIASQSARYYRK